MLEIHESIHVMLMLLAHVMRGAGTFTLEDKVKMTMDVIQAINQNSS